MHRQTFIFLLSHKITTVQQKTKTKLHQQTIHITTQSKTLKKQTVKTNTTNYLINQSQKQPQQTTHTISQSKTRSKQTVKTNTTTHHAIHQDFEY